MRCKMGLRPQRGIDDAAVAGLQILPTGRNYRPLMPASAPVASPEADTTEPDQPAPQGQ